MFTAHSIAHSLSWMTPNPKTWILCGGGRKNKTLVRFILQELQKHVSDVVLGDMDDYGWDGDFIEAQAFAVLACRSLSHMPISFPSTTGVSTPMSGGTLALP
jgi:anhydro-N-acetylmuramic acid kinase